MAMASLLRFAPYLAPLLIIGALIYLIREDARDDLIQEQTEKTLKRVEEANEAANETAETVRDLNRSELLDRVRERGLGRGVPDVSGSQSGSPRQGGGGHAY